jgi:uncharacterized membrane protein
MAMDDRRLETIIGNLLRAGVLTAASIVLAGGVHYVVTNYSAKISFEGFTVEGDDLRTLTGIVKSAAHLHSAGLIQLGLLLLIATPVARVVLAAVGFYLEKDRLYAMISLVVLAVLVFSLLHAT